MWPQSTETCAFGAAGIWGMKEREKLSAVCPASRQSLGLWLGYDCQHGGGITAAQRQKLSLGIWGRKAFPKECCLPTAELALVRDLCMMENQLKTHCSIVRKLLLVSSDIPAHHTHCAIGAVEWGEISWWCSRHWPAGIPGHQPDMAVLQTEHP